MCASHQSDPKTTSMNGDGGEEEFWLFGYGYAPPDRYHC